MWLLKCGDKDTAYLGYNVEKKMQIFATKLHLSASNK